MNKNILHADIQQYINNNLITDITKILFKRTSFTNVSTQEIVRQIEAKKKCKTKLPTWFASNQIYYPNKLNIEQTSSEITANYKASLISGTSLIDITGGFGVDAFAFSKRFKKVFHCEINEDLSQIVTHNYQQLGVKNIQTIPSNGLEFLKNTTQKFDYLYIDPSRRNDAKGKVFLLKDCLPNVPQNIDFLFTKSDNILIKNSPILDITSAINELKFVKEIHIIAIKNEVKELLFLLEKNYKNDVLIKTINIQKNGYEKFEFLKSEKVFSTYSDPLAYLYEPNSAILKSGGFHQITHQLEVFKLHQHSHLYTSGKLIDFPGRVFEIEKILPYDKKHLKRIFKGKKANISTRNFPETVAQIRKSIKIKDGGNYYLFFTTTKNNKSKVLICVKSIK